MHLLQPSSIKGSIGLERQPRTFQQFSKHIHVIGKIVLFSNTAARCKLLLLRTYFIRFSDGAEQCPSEAAHPLPVAFHKTRYLSKIHFTLLTESLHRIKHSITHYMPLPNIRKEYCRLYAPIKHSPFPETIWGNNSTKPRPSANDMQLRGICSFRLCQSLRRFFCTPAMRNTEPFSGGGQD